MKGKKLALIVLISLIINLIPFANVSAATQTFYIDGYKMTLLYNNIFEAKFTTDIVNNKKITAVWPKRSNVVTINIEQYKVVKKKNVLQSTNKYTITLSNMDRTSFDGKLKDLSTNKITYISQKLSSGKTQASYATPLIGVGITTGDIVLVVAGLLIIGIVIVAGNPYDVVPRSIEKVKEQTKTNPERIYYLTFFAKDGELGFTLSNPLTLSEAKSALIFSKRSAYTLLEKDAKRLCEVISPEFKSTLIHENHFYNRKPGTTALYFDHYHPKGPGEDGRLDNHCFFGMGK